MGVRSPATQAQRLRARTLRDGSWRVRPHTVLAGVIASVPRLRPGSETKWGGKSLENGGGDLPQCAQHCADPDVLRKRRQGRWKGREKTWEEALEQVQRGVHGPHASPDPTQRTGQLNVQA
jgi:hypothetical protein